MVDFSSGIACKDTCACEVDDWCCIDAARDWTSVVNFILDGDWILWKTGILADSIGVVLLWDGTASVWRTVFAKSLSVTLETLVVGKSLVRGTRAIGDDVVVHPLECADRITSVTSIVSHVAGKKDLWRNIDFRELSTSHDSDSVTDG